MDKKKKVIIGVSSGIVALLTAGLVWYVSVDRVTVEKTSSKEFKRCNVSIDKESVSSMNIFAWMMYDEMSKDNELLISPYSMYIAMAILDNGTNGEGKKELDKLLGVDNIDNINKELNTLINSLNDDKAVINTSNSLWKSDKYIFADEATSKVIDPAKMYYNADIFSVDMSSKTTYDDINTWVSKSTDKMINPYIEDIDQEIINNKNTALRIINAVYYEGKWAEKFEAKNTTNEAFYGTDETKDVEMMKLSSKEFNYYADDTLKAISIPYKGNTVMDVVMTKDEEISINDVFDSLSVEKKNELFDNISKSDEISINVLKLPKFEYASDKYNMIDAFKNMGINAVFTKGSLDSLGKDLFVKYINHKAKIEVDEDGARAAAVSDIGLGCKCSPIQTEMVDFIVNRPFVYTIRDTKTNTLLFIGKMNNIN